MPKEEAALIGSPLPFDARRRVYDHDLRIAYWATIKQLREHPAKQITYGQCETFGHIAKALGKDSSDVQKDLLRRPQGYCESCYAPLRVVKTTHEADEFTIRRVLCRNGCFEPLESVYRESNLYLAAPFCCVFTVETES